MTKVDENIQTAQNMLSGIVERCYELEEGNKKLKECNKSQSEVINNVFIPQRERLEEENKELKKENENLKEILAYVTDKEHTPYIDDGRGWRRARKV